MLFSMPHHYTTFAAQKKRAPEHGRAPVCLNACDFLRQKAHKVDKTEAAGDGDRDRERFVPLAVMPIHEDAACDNRAEVQRGGNKKDRLCGHRELRAASAQQYGR